MRRAVWWLSGFAPRSLAVILLGFQTLKREVEANAQ